MERGILLGDPIYNKKNPGMFKKWTFEEIWGRCLDIFKKVFKANWRYLDVVSKYPPISSKYPLKKYMFCGFFQICFSEIFNFLFFPNVFFSKIDEHFHVYFFEKTHFYIFSKFFFCFHFFAPTKQTQLRHNCAFFLVFFADASFCTVYGSQNSSFCLKKNKTWQFVG